MGTADGSVAKLWRYEFEKNGIEYDEIVLIGNNLSELDRPEFIPNVFQVINIIKKIHDDPELKIAHERIPRGLPHLLTKKEIDEVRSKTKSIRKKSFNEINNILG